MFRNQIFGDIFRNQTEADKDEPFKVIPYEKFKHFINENPRFFNSAFTSFFTDIVKYKSSVLQSKITHKIFEKVEYSFNSSKDFRKLLSANNDYPRVPQGSLEELLNSNHTNYHIDANDEQDYLVSYIERFTSEKIYHLTFHTIVDEGKFADLDLYRKLCSIKKINGDSLTEIICPEIFKNKLLRNEIFVNMETLNEILTNGLLCRSATAKIIAINKFSKRAFEIVNKCFKQIQAGGDSSLTATSNDDFFPIYIYIILYCNPPFLLSNIKFINLYSPENLLNQGEIAYFFTNFSAAVEYLSNISAKTLKMTDHEYQILIDSEQPSWKIQIKLLDSTAESLNQKIKNLNN